MLREIVRFECAVQVRRATFPIACGIFGLLGFGLAASGFGPGNLPLNAPYTVALSTGLLSLAAIFLAAAFSTDAVVRDVEQRTEEIVHATPVGRAPLLLGRFLGSSAVAVAAALPLLPGLLLGASMPWHDPARLGPVDLLAYLWPAAILLLPNILLAAAALFAVAALTRRALAGHIAAVALYALYFVAALLTDSPLMASSGPAAGSVPGAALLDPTGLSALFEQTRYWTPVERSTRLLRLSGSLLANRLLWVSLAAGLLLLTHRVVPFRVAAGRVRRRRTAPPAHSPPVSHVPAAVAPAGPGRWLRAFLSAARLDLRGLLRSPPGLLLLVLWVGTAGVEVASAVLGGEHGTALLPTTGLLVATLRQPLTLYGLLGLIVVSTELVWRERRWQLDGILDATPVPAGLFVAAKGTAMAVLVVLLVTIAVLVGLLVQMVRGGADPEPALYLSLYYHQGLPLVLFGVVTLLVHTLAPYRTLGMLLVLAVAVLGRHPELVGLDHPLWRFPKAPPVEHTAMNGFGPFAAPFHWSMAYAGAAALLCAVAATGLWRQRSSAGTGARLRRLARLRGPRRLAAGAALLVLVASGGVILYSTTLLNPYRTPDAICDWRAAYERRYRPLAGLAQPRIRAITSRLDLYPGERRYRVEGTYRLVNDSGRPVETVLVAVRREAEDVALSLAGGRLVDTDRRFGMLRFELGRPLAPGEETELSFRLAVDHRGFVAGRPDTSIVDNGSFLPGHRVYPTIGYRRSRELTDPVVRRERGLPVEPTGAPGAGRPGHGDGGSAPVGGFMDWDLTVSTAGDQIAVAPGQLVERWREGGRRVFRYRSSRPIRNAVAVASARYEVVRTRHGAVEVAIYYHPDHDVNVHRMLEAAVRSLELFEARFGPYPQDDLKIVEIPSTWSFAGLARPGLVLLVEDRLFLTDTREPGRLDLVSRRIAHEVAHQWWGLWLSPEGAGSMLVESTAKHAALAVLDHLHGPGAVRRCLGYELEGYLRGRAGAYRAEAPLVRAGQRPYVYYRKGAIVLRAVEELLGGERMARVLGALMAEHGGPGGKITPEHLVDALARAAPARDRWLVREWMEEVVLYDLAVEAVEARPLGGDRYAVTMTVSVAKERPGDGHPRALRVVDEPLGIAVYGAHPDVGGEPLHLATHRLDGGRQTITLEVDGPPAYVAIDPYRLRLDRTPGDDLRRVE